MMRFATFLFFCRDCFLISQSFLLFSITSIISFVSIVSAPTTRKVDLFNPEVSEWAVKCGVKVEEEYDPGLWDHTVEGPTPLEADADGVFLFSVLALVCNRVKVVYHLTWVCYACEEMNSLIVPSGLHPTRGRNRDQRVW